MGMAIDTIPNTIIYCIRLKGEKDEKKWKIMRETLEGEINIFSVNYQLQRYHCQISYFHLIQLQWFEPINQMIETSQFSLNYK